LSSSTDFVDALRDAAQDAGLTENRFPVRNLLMDELVTEQRMQGYLDMVEPGTADYVSWRSRHADYVAASIHLTAFPSGLPKALRQRNARECPETFRTTPALTRFGGTDEDVDLVRVVRLWALAQAADLEEDETLDLLLDPDPTVRDYIVELWSEALAIEPVFATFWWHVRDLLPADAADAPAEWADDLRDRLGLSHYDPAVRGPFDIVVLCYPVSAVRAVVGLRGRQALAVPTSLDSDAFPPFCPAPEESRFGQVVNLDARGAQPAPEVVHPTAEWVGAHVYRVGTVTRPIRALAEARAVHLLRLQDDADRPDYGLDTDADLLC
jgi:hypothetical protein